MKLLYFRDIKGIPISSSAFLKQQELILPKLAIALTKWVERNCNRLYAFGEVLSYFGCLGLNGTVIPTIAELVESAFNNFPRNKNGFLNKAGQVRKCPNTAFLWAVFKLGFSKHP